MYKRQECANASSTFSITQSGLGGSVNIYVRNGFDFRAAEFAFTSSDISVAAFTGGTFENPVVLGAPRFDVGLVELTGAAQDGSVGRFIGLTILAFGVQSSLAEIDPTYDPILDAFLLATLNYDLVDFGSVDFALEASGNGVLSNDSVLVDPVFGSPVTLTVAVPEPSSAILLAFGFAGFATRRRR